MNYIDDETPRHKKKSQAKPPKKSKHKHIFEPCIIEIPDDWYKKQHERNGKRRAQFYGYCPICGVESDKYPFRCFETIPTEEGARELNPETRTLPTFYNDDPFPKFVTVN